MLLFTAHIHAQPGLVGSLGGEVSVSALGTASYSIPIEVVPGTRGVQPNLAVTYNSALGRGMLGSGWTLTGLSAVGRTPRIPHFDNATGSVNFDGDDRLALDGERLVKLGSGPYFASEAVYATETENFTRVTLKGAPNTASQYFTAVDATDNALEYGRTPDSRQELPQGGVLSWLIGKVTDPDGNCMEFTYLTDTATTERLPARIEYTKNTAAGLQAYAAVEFDYAADPNANKTYVGGNTMKTGLLLSGIRVLYEGTAVRQYAFEYDFDRTSRLKTVTLKGATGSELTSTKVVWGEDGDVTAFSSVTGLANKTVVAGDFDGDNVTDLFTCTDGYEKSWQVLKGDGTGQFSPTTLTGTVQGYTSFFAVDLEGDGRDEVAYIVQNSSNSGQYLLKAIRFLPSVTTTTLDANGTSQFLIGDFTGTGGVQDVKVSEASGGCKTVTLTCLNTSIVVGEDHKVMVTDLNGNGKSDIQVVRSSQIDVYELDEASGSFVKIRDGHWFPENPVRPCFADINGDGNMDFIYYDHNNGDGRWRLKVSKGNDYLPPQTMPFNAAHGSYTTPLFPLLVSDINGDGKDDIVQPVQYGTDPVTVNVYYTRGYSRQGGYVYDLLPVQNSGITNGYAGCFQFAEMNGDGKNEMLHKNSVFASGLVVADLPERRGHDLAAAFNDGFGKTTSVEYLFFSSPSMASMGGDGKRVRYPLVSRVSEPDGTGGSAVAEHAYYDAVFDHGRRQVLGFLLTKARREGTCAIQKHKLDQGHSLLAPEQSLAHLLPPGQGGPTGYVADTTGWRPGNGVLYHLETLNTPACLDLAYGRFVPYNAVSSAVNRLENTKATTRVWLNSQGRVEKTATAHGKAKTQNGVMPWTERDSTVCSYTTVSLPNGNSSVRPAATTAWNRRNGSALSPHRTTQYAYDASGRTASVTVSDSEGTAGTTTFTYNSLGLPLTETLTPKGMQARTTSYSYDARGRFNTGVTDPLGHTSSASFDNRTGWTLSETDANGLTTSYTHDALGRVTRVVRPDGTRRSVLYSWHDGTEFPDAVWTVTESEAGTPLTRTYHDILGRAVHTYTEGTGYTDIAYDSLGNVAMETAVPYDSPNIPEGSKTWRRHAHDRFGRVVAETAPYTNLSYAYYEHDSATHHDRFVTVTDSIRQTTRTTAYDALGRPIKAEDAGGCVSYAYHYQSVSGAIRDVTTISVDGGGTTTVVSDTRGNRLSIQDPDAGTVASTYNALGQTVTRTDANGVVTEYSYDLAGRTTRVVYSRGNDTEVVAYTYDNAPGKGVGKLASVSHDGNDELEYQYDTLGRLADYIVIDGYAVHEHLYQYDTLGRLRVLTYPDGFRIRHSYNELGELKDIRDDADNSVIYSIGSRDRFRHPVKSRFGNGTGTQCSYNALGMLTGIRNGNTNFQQGGEVNGGPSGTGMEKPYEIGSQYRNLSYTYDERGLIASRTDSTAAQSETYSYDQLDRLVSHTVNGVHTDTYAYAPNGNITQNSRVGSYSYASQKPHAVTQVSGVPGNASPLPSQCEVEYNLMNRPSLIMESGYRIAIGYGADGMRRHTVITEGNTLVKEKTRVSGLFELEDTPSSSRRLDYIQAEGRTVAVRVTQGGSASLYYVLTDHLGSWERVLDGNKASQQQTHFDPWGNRMAFNDWATPQAQTSFLFDRGFTGHEHYDSLRVINANARLYDPVIGRFFSPDPFVQEPDFSQSFNRYSYCMNNPVMYSDPDGEWVHIVIGAVIGGAVNLGIKAINGQIDSFLDGAMAFGIGAVAGAVGAATGGAAFTALGGAAAGAGGFIAGAGGAMMGTAFSSHIESMGNAIYFQDPLITPKQYLVGIGVSGIMGGIVNGATALLNGRTFLTGDIIFPKPYQTPPKPSFNIETPESTLNTEGLRSQLVLPQDPGSQIYYLDNAKYYTKEIDGMRFTLRDPSFRKNLISVSGIDPGEAAQAHHIFPIKYSYFFNRAGINPNSYGAWWGEGHLKNAYQYNKAWGIFIKNNPNANQEEIFNFAIQLKLQFKY